MKDKLKNILKNFSYSLSANLISLLISTVVILVLPKLIGVEEYGFWQLYLFYSSYVGFLHFGWNDGIYLRYGGEEYKNLDKANFFSQFYSLLMLQFFIACFIGLGSLLVVDDKNRKFIFIMIAFQMIIVNTRYMLLYILQATNRIKEYSIVTMIDRVLYFILLLFLLIIGLNNFYVLVFADLIGKIISLFYSMYLCRDIVFRKVSDFYNITQDVVESIIAGSQLMLSNIANTLIVGIVRFGIERNWDVSIFGKISLSLSLTNMFMVFINALGLVIYPILRRINKKSLTDIYLVMRDFLMTFALGVLILYLPIKQVLSLWLPQYAESLNYLGILLPIMVYESKMSLLINTYMKALRLENIMLKFNGLTMLISVIFTWISAFILHNLDLTVLSIVMLIAFRGITSEIILSKRLHISLLKDIVLESIMIVIFIYTSWYFESWVSTILYGIIYAVYLLLKRKDLINSVNYISNILKS